MDRGAWRAAHGVAESQTRLSNTFTFRIKGRSANTKHTSEILKTDCVFDSAVKIFYTEIASLLFRNSVFQGLGWDMGNVSLEIGTL